MSDDQSSLEWLRWRQSGIGASDVPAIMGVSPWSTPQQIYLSKVSPITEEPETNYAIERGNRLEPKARAYYEMVCDD